MLTNPNCCRTVVRGCFNAAASSVRLLSTVHNKSTVFRRQTPLRNTIFPSSKPDRFAGVIQHSLLKRCFCSKVRQDVDKRSDVESNEASQGVTNFMDEIDMEEITQGNSELEKKVKLIVLEIDIMRQEGLQVPTRLTTDELKDAVGLPSRSARHRFYRFVWMNEMKDLNDPVRKERKRQAKLEKQLKRSEELNEENHIKYRLGSNTIFIRFSDTTMNFHLNYKLMQAMMFGSDFIVDCGYDQYMTFREGSNCAKQMTYMFSYNRSQVEPFNLHFCNVDFNGNTLKKLHRNIPTLLEPDFPINLTEKHYLDLFPKEKLVYLTPHCKHDLTTFNHDDIYIMGAMVDKVNCEPLSLAKAKSEGLRMAKFPLDRYLHWGCGSKSLTLDQCLMIMMELKNSGNWEKALTHVPKRKLVQVADGAEMDAAISRLGQSKVGSIKHEWGFGKKKDQRRATRPYMPRIDFDDLLVRKRRPVED